MLAIKNFTAKLASDLTKISMNDFFKLIHAQFYPDQNIEFMDYFLELVEHEDEFYVPHAKLIEYGIMTCTTDSSKVRAKLETLNLENEVDFRLADVREPVKQGGFSTKKVYYLTPEAFKKCLMRAQRRKNQPVDPVIYCNYYLLLEKAYKFYTDYERQYADKIISIKDDKIDTLIKQNNVLITMNTDQSKQLTDQSNQINSLITYAKDRKIEITMLNQKIDILFDFMISFAKMTIPMWIGSNVIKYQYDTLVKGKTVGYGLTHLKIMYSVAFFEPLDETTPITVKDKTINVRANIKQYFCCTNFADVGIRIKNLYKRHGESMYMLKPQAISLISCEINTERTILERMNIFPDKVFVDYSNKHKSFDLQTSKCSTNGITDIYDTIIANAKQERFQAYQMRIDSLKNTDKCLINDNILERITTADEAFFGDTLPFCQRFIDCYTKESLDEDNNFIEWMYIKSDQTRKKYPNINNQMTDRTYSLKMIQHLIRDHNNVDAVDDMVRTGVISKRDIDSLKEIARVEEIDISELDFPEDDSDEE